MSICFAKIELLAIFAKSNIFEIFRVGLVYS